MVNVNVKMVITKKILEMLFVPKLFLVYLNVLTVSTEDNVTLVLVLNNTKISKLVNVRMVTKMMEMMGVSETAETM